MSENEFLLRAIGLIPLCFSILSLFFLSSWRMSFVFVLTAVGLTTMTSFLATINVWTIGSINAVESWLYLDALSSFHLILLNLVFLITTIYAWVYFEYEINEKKITTQQVSRFSSLWLFAYTSMVLVLISNNIGMIWVGIETTSLITTFLICIHKNRQTIEAMWKYLILCSVGVAFALLGTIFLAVSAGPVNDQLHDVLLWTNLMSNAGGLNSTYVKVGFIFILIGYGTKAGLAPMHTWLPDAHSQAPGPVSAMFSGFMLSLALYCIMRFIPIVEVNTGGHGWALSMLTVMGILSILIAAVFIVYQFNVKRLLAYSSIEHIGIVALALGLGSFGNFIALFHTLNHMFSKTLAFCAAGRLGQFYKSHEIRKISHSLKYVPLWGGALMVGFLSLIGMVPFPIFISKILLIKTFMQKGQWSVLVFFILGTAVVFIEITRYFIALGWRRNELEAESRPQLSLPGVDYILVIMIVVVLVLLGTWMPDSLSLFITQAASVISGGVK